MLPGFGLATNAGRPAGGFEIEDTQVAGSSGIVEHFVQLSGFMEQGFHLPHQGQGAQGLGPGQLA